MVFREWVLHPLGGLAWFAVNLVTACSVCTSVFILVLM